jgi:hypothetical protein
MKLRKGFVSNSSSSSFVCDICGGIESGWDLSYSDVDMTECSKGHCFHYGCLSKKDKAIIEAGVKGDEDKEPDEDDDDDDGEEDIIPTELCPVCQLRVVSDNLVQKFLRMKSGKSLDQLGDDIRAEYKNSSQIDEAFKAFEEKVDKKK